MSDVRWRRRDSPECELGLEGVVAKHRDSLYRPGDRGWLKIKNPDYWRRNGERERCSACGSVERELVLSASRGKR